MFSGEGRPKMSTLNGLMNDWRELQEMALDPEIDADAIADTLEGLEAELEDKADGYAEVMNFVKGQIEIVKIEQDRLRNRRLMFEAKLDRMKASLEGMMNETGKRKFQTALHSFRIQKNPPKVVIDKPDIIPEGFLIAQEPKVDTRSLLNYLKDGNVVVWAHLEQSEGLRIS